MRGEYTLANTIKDALEELPPRARRIRHLLIFLKHLIGTTSACAENTRTAWEAASTVWNYLRVRGEYTTLHQVDWPYAELPPRARRIPPDMMRATLRFGTTSACAENTGC